MGQALWCYDCCWFAECHFWLGLSYGIGVCNCWICMPTTISDFRDSQCMTCGPCNQGCGSTLCCFGAYVCAPEWLQLYSIRQTIGNKRPVFRDCRVIDHQGQGPASAGNMYQQ